MAHVTKLILAFPGQQLTEQQADAMADVFADALAEYTPDNVRDACISWSRHQNGEGNENYAFPPSAPQLARLAQKAQYGFRNPPSRYETLNAPDMPPEPTEAEKNRVQALVDNLKASRKQPKRQPEKQIPIPEQKVLDEMKDRYAELRKVQWQAAQPGLEREAVESLMNREGRKGN